MADQTGQSDPMAQRVLKDLRAAWAPRGQSEDLRAAWAPKGQSENLRAQRVLRETMANQGWSEILNCPDYPRESKMAV